MGKTEKGAVWLNPDLFSPYDYWQFWRNTDDRDVKNFLNFFTEISSEKIDNLFENKTNINNLKVLLANEATKILHGDKAAAKAETTARQTFEAGAFGKELPEIKIKKNNIEKGIKIIELISLNKILSSKSEVRRAIKGKAIKLNNKTLDDENRIINLRDFEDNKILKISFGKKKHYLIKII